MSAAVMTSPITQEWDKDLIREEEYRTLTTTNVSFVSNPIVAPRCADANFQNEGSENDSSCADHEIQSKAMDNNSSMKENNDVGIGIPIGVEMTEQAEEIGPLHYENENKTDCLEENVECNLEAGSISNETQEQVPLNHLQSSAEHTTPLSPPIRQRGIRNLGNTCYLNSAMQLLMGIGGFSQEIIDSYQKDQVRDVESCSKEAAKYPLRDALALFFLSMQQQPSQSPNEHDLYQNAGDPTELKKVIDEKTSLFEGFWQQDAHEFLNSILDLLHEELDSDENDDGTKNGSDEKSIKTEATVDCNSEDEQFQSPMNDNDFVFVDTVPSSSLNISNHTMESNDSEREHKKARHSSSSTLTKALSFSELGCRGISSLLHGDSEDLTTELVETYSLCQELPTSNAETFQASDVQNPSENSSMTTESVDKSEDNTSKEKPFWNPSNIVDNYFTTIVRTHLTCESCKFTRSKDEVYRNISVDVGLSNDTCQENSIEEGLRNFFKTEKHELKCEKCFCESAVVEKQIAKLPKALIIHLKRFIVDISADYSSISYRKNDSPVELNNVLSLRDNDNNSFLATYLTNDVTFPNHSQTTEDDEIDTMSVESEASYIDVLKKNQRYEIRGVVHHLGESAHCGHYTADALREEAWLRFNDAYVTRMGKSEMLSNGFQQTCYMVSYDLV